MVGGHGEVIMLDHGLVVVLVSMRGGKEPFPNPNPELLPLTRINCYPEPNSLDADWESVVVRRRRHRNIGGKEFGRRPRSYGRMINGQVEEHRMVVVMVEVVEGQMDVGGGGRGGGEGEEIHGRGGGRGEHTRRMRRRRRGTRVGEEAGGGGGAGQGTGEVGHS